MSPFVHRPPADACAPPPARTTQGDPLPSPCASASCARFPNRRPAPPPDDATSTEADGWAAPQAPAIWARAVVGTGVGAAMMVDASRRILLPAAGADPIFGVPEMMAGTQLLTHMPRQALAAWCGTWYHPADACHQATRQRLLLASSMVNYIGLARQGLQELTLVGPSSWAFLAMAQGVPGAVALGIELGRPTFFTFDDRYYAWSAHRITAALLPTAALLAYDAWAAWPSSPWGAAAYAGATIGAGVAASYAHRLAEERLTDWRAYVCHMDLGVSVLAFGTALGVWALRGLQLLD